MNEEKEPEETTVSETSNLEQSSIVGKSEIKRCPICGSRWDPVLSNESSFFTYLICILVFYFFGIFSIFLLPIVIPSTKTAVVRCSDCFEVLEQRDLFSLPSLSDKVLNFRFGSCALVISRKYALVLILIIGGLLTLRTFTQPPAPPQTDQEGGGIISWENYIRDCGRNVFIGNELKAKKTFREKYKNQKVDWQGVFIEFSEKNHHILVKMEPTDSIDELPDLRLFLGEYSSANYRKFASDLLQNEVLSFTGTLSELGGEYNLHTLYLKKIDKTGIQKNLKDITSFADYKQLPAGGLRKGDKN